MSVHLSLSGKWVQCNAKVRACPRVYHLETSVEEARKAPLPFLDQLLGVQESEIIEQPDGSKRWLDKKGETHRDYDLPAYVRGNGSHNEWWQHGQRHRGGDKPAVQSSVGYQAWYHRNQLHRVGKPAVVRPNGDVEFWENGRLLRKVPISPV